MNRVLVATKGLEGSIVEQSIPEPPPKGAVVKILRSGVCHSDAHLYKADTMPTQFPVVLGHEIAGVIHSLGEDDSEGTEPLAVGDRVVVYPWGGCRNCWTCKLGSNHCGFRRGPDAHAYGVHQPGGFQEYISVKSRWSVLRLPEQIPLDVGCLAPCSALTAFHALDAIKEALHYAIRGKQLATVVFVGAGGLSLWATEMIKAIYGANVKLVVVDLQEEKLADAKATGADVTVCWKKDDDIATKSQQLLEAAGEKVDAAIDFVSMPSTVETVIQVLANNATYALVGIFGGQFPPVALMRVTLANIRVQGVYTGTKGDLQELFTLWADKKLKGPPITHIALEDVKEQMEGMLENRVLKGRAVIKFNE